MTTRIHLAKTGTFRDAHDRAVTLDAALLTEMADSYDPARHKAPLVLGHPEDGAPAYGWVDKLEVGDNGDLYGIVGEVAADLAEAVSAGRYRNVSISYWPKGHAQSPDKARTTLRHVGVLGAQVPAVRGLTPLSFAEDPEGVVTVDLGETAWGWSAVKDFMRGMREYIIGREGQETADRIVPAYLIDVADDASDKAAENAPRFADAVPKTAPEPPLEDPLKQTKQEPAMSGTDTKTTDLAEREAKLADREAKVAEMEADAAKAEAAAQKTAAIAFADSLIKDGKLAPAGKDVIVDLHQLLAGTAEPVSFADGTSKPKLAAFTELLTGAKPIINLGEVSKGDGSTTELDGSSSDAIGARAKAIQKDNPAISFSEAARQAEQEASK